MLAKLCCETAEEGHVKRQNIFSEEDTQVDSSNTSGTPVHSRTFTVTSAVMTLWWHMKRKTTSLPHPNDSETNDGEITRKDNRFSNNLTTSDNTVSLGCDCNEVLLSDSGTPNLPIPDSSKEENPRNPLPNQHPTVPSVVDSTMASSSTDYVLDESFNSRNMPSDVVVPKSSSNSQLEGNYLHKYTVAIRKHSAREQLAQIMF